ncbi:hypothetical protein SAY86_003015 [Trapa natans]|uniref:Uncharacterized protein n=1 Tax=Trapa natans TaxID=22666 RepID=A0AAN7LH82_TRANT|nr:hypothetical protein SAY86_003015 [Trapa natans]
MGSKRKLTLFIERHVQEHDSGRIKCLQERNYALSLLNSIVRISGTNSPYAITVSSEAAYTRRMEAEESEYGESEEDCEIPVAELLMT